MSQEEYMFHTEQVMHMATKVKDVMVRDVKTADSEETILRAAEIMNRYEIGCIVVTDNGQPVGVLTERDILKRVVFKRKDPGNTKLHEVMSKPLATVKPNITATSAARMMVKRKIKKLPVVNSDRLVGMLSLTDLIPLLRAGGTRKKLSLNGAPEGMKRVFEVYIDPETQVRKKCPLIVLGGMAIGCMMEKCMWFNKDGCCFQSIAQIARARHRG
jgi:CBS domain-containing protein